MHSTYLDFDLEIGVGQGREYPVAVLRSPAGEGRAAMLFPYDELALENRLLILQNALLRSGGKRRSVLLPEQQAVRDFGQALFDALFVGEVRSRYDVSLERAQQAGKGLRLRLRFQSPALAALPWEFLYDSREAEYICLTASTPLVRYLDLPRPPQALAVAPPLRILGLVCSPQDLPQLDADNEKRRVEKALKDLRYRGLVELHWLPAPTWWAVQEAMRGGPWHVFHFVGHGGFDAGADEGLIYLADEQGRASPLRASEVGRLLADHRHLRLAVLNACEGARGSKRDIFSSTASILVRRGLPAVVAMQYEITDRAAVELSRAFYKVLAENWPVDAAVAEARKAVSFAVANTVEWGTPVLYMRAPDGVLFDLETVPKPLIPSPDNQVPIVLSPVPALDPLPVGKGDDSEPPLPPAPDPLPVGKGDDSEPPLPPAPDPLPVGKGDDRKAQTTTLNRQRSLRQVVLALLLLGSAILIILVIRTQLASPTFPLSISQTSITPTAPVSGAPNQLTAATTLASTIAAVGMPPAQTLAPTSTRSGVITPTPTPTTTALPTKLVFNNEGAVINSPLRMELVRVPAGEFLMGSNPVKDGAVSKDQEPQHMVSLAEFYISRHEVTNEQYAVFVETTGHDVPRNWDKNVVPAGMEDHPVVFVSWYDVLAFTEWLSRETGSVIRLPTEAEWEKACRGTDGFIFPWGDEFDGNKTNTRESGIGATTSVGSYSPVGDSPYHAADMAGNVIEWTSSLFRAYPYDPADSREDKNNFSEGRVLRGGSFYNTAQVVGCTSRVPLNPTSPSDRGPDLGFRVVLTPR